MGYSRKKPNRVGVTLPLEIPDKTESFTPETPQNCVNSELNPSEILLESKTKTPGNSPICSCAIAFSGCKKELTGACSCRKAISKISTNFSNCEGVYSRKGSFLQLVNVP